MLDLSPAADSGLVGRNELIVHGWDMSRASGQQFAVDERLVPAWSAR
jgi:hypothetical protein